MTKLIYITHPSVEIDKDKLPHEWGLSQKGFEQAKQLVEQPFWSEVNVIYSSTEPKAIQVAELASKNIVFLGCRKRILVKRIELLPLFFL